MSVQPNENSASDYPAYGDGLESYGQSRSMTRGASLCLLGVVFLVSIMAFLVAPDQMTRPYMTFAVMLGIGTLVIQLMHRAAGPRPVNWVTVDVFFMISYAMVHFTAPLFYTIGMVSEADRVWWNPQVVPASTMLSVSGLAAFAFGFNLLAERYHRVEMPQYLNLECLKVWKHVGGLVFMLGVGTTAVYLVIIGSALTQGGYSGVMGGYGGQVVLVLLAVLLFTGFAILSIVASQMTGKWSIGLLPKIAAAVFCGQALIMGDRSLALKMGLLVAVCYAEFVKHVSFKKFMLALLGGMFLMGVVRVARQGPERTLGALVKTAESGEVTWLTSVSNAAGSATTLYAALDTVPNYYDHFYGSLKVSGIAGVVPFSRRLMPKRVEYLSSDLFLTWIINGGDFRTGRGTTIVADIYLDFGVPGVVIVLFGLGMMAKGIQQKARGTGSITWGVAYVTLLPVMALMSRYPITGLIRAVLWPVMIVWLISKVFGLSRNAAVDPEWVDEDGFEYDEGEQGGDPAYY